MKLDLLNTEAEQIELMVIAHTNVANCVQRFGLTDERTQLAINACRAVENAIYDPCLLHTLQANHGIKALAEAMGVDTARPAPEDNADD